MKSSNTVASTNRRLRASALAICALFGTSTAYCAGVLPSGGKFVAGTGTIQSNGTQLTINQGSRRGIIDWTQFSIGDGNRVTIQNGAGATLNRVTGGIPSWIMGTLTATGSVYLINPQGILIGPSGVVATGGRFVASTLDTTNASFMNGGPLTFSGNSTANVVNLGAIGSSGGDVFLIARGMVMNAGTITAPTGSVELAAGQSVLLQDAASQQVFVQAGSGGTVANIGTLAGAQVSLQAADGNIYAFGGNHAAIRATGTAKRDGHIWLVADRGTVLMDQTVAAHNANGTGGTVDTVAQFFVPGSNSLTVQAGAWNLTLPTLTITQPIAIALSNSLTAGTSTNVNAKSGNVEVASDISWSGKAALTIGASSSIVIDVGTTVRNQGAGNLTLRADAGAIDNGGSVTNNGTIDWSKSTGFVRALYDMNGSYKAGKVLTNAAWLPATGSGLLTQMTAYKLVNSIADLGNVEQDLAGIYALGKDLDYNNPKRTPVPPFTPLGDSNTPFSGQFDGMGHTIANLLIMPVSPDGQSLPPAGLFGVIDTPGVVRNLNLTQAHTVAINPGFDTVYAGVLAGINKGHITNVSVSGELDGNQYLVEGGLVGRNEGLIERSAANVYVAADFSEMGGLAGENAGTISQSYATGAVYGPYHGLTGGLVFDNTGTISQSFATGAVTGDAMGTWGAIASSNEGTVTGDNYWNVETTGLTDGGGAPAANGLTTAQMSRAASFAGWDFGANGIWSMPAGATHPVLRWQVVGAQ